MKIENGENYGAETLGIIKEGLDAELERVTKDSNGEFIDFANLDELIKIVMERLFDNETHSGAPSPNLVKDSLKAQAKINGNIKNIKLIYSVNLEKFSYYAVALETTDRILN